MFFSSFGLYFFLWSAFVIHKPEFHRLCYNFELRVNCLFCYSAKHRKKGKILYLLLHVLWKYKEIFTRNAEGSATWWISLWDLNGPIITAMEQINGALPDRASQCGLGTGVTRSMRTLWFCDSLFAKSLQPKSIAMKAAPFLNTSPVYHSESHLPMLYCCFSFTISPQCCLYHTQQWLGDNKLVFIAQWNKLYLPARNNKANWKFWTCIIELIDLFMSWFKTCDNILISININYLEFYVKVELKPI